MSKESLLDQVIELDDVAVDSAPFQLVLGSSLYKVRCETVRSELLLLTFFAKKPK